MKRLFLALIVIFLSMGTAAADSRQYNGTWINTNSNTRGLTKVVIKGAGGKANVHVWGKCTPQDCDLGWSNCNSYLDGHLSTRYRNDFSVRTLTITLPSSGRLKVQMHTHFIDDSGRPDQDAAYTFRRVLTQVQQKPKPLGGFLLKPPSEEPTGKY